MNELEFSGRWSSVGERGPLSDSLQVHMMVCLICGLISFWLWQMPAFNAQPAKKVTSGSQSSMSASSASGVSRQASDAEESCIDSGASPSSTDKLKMVARPVGKRSSRLLKDVEEKPRVTKMSPTVKRCIVRRAGKAAESQEKLDLGNVKAIVSKIEKALSGEDNGAVVVEGDPAVESDTETATVAQNADNAMHVDVEVEVEAPALESGKPYHKGLSSVHKTTLKSCNLATHLRQFPCSNSNDCSHILAKYSSRFQNCS